MTPPLGLATQPALGLAAAAKACGVSESTLRRKRPDLLAAGAKQTAKGWSIPIPALIELGLMDRTTLIPADSPSQPSQEAPTTASTPTPMEPLVEALRAQLADAEKRAAVAEAIAEERERIISVQAQALRMLESSKTPVANTAAREAARDDVVVTAEKLSTGSEPAQEDPKRRWWRRKLF